MRPSLGDLINPSISSAEAAMLEISFLESEIFEAVNDYGSTKAPGPDGFNMRLFKKIWELIKDLVDAIDWFWEKWEISRGCNASFVTLVPEKNDPMGLGDYRPISLIGSYYNIVSKILSNWLRKVLPLLVGIEQSDGALIANEMVDFLKTNKKKSFLFKVDFEKAFDSLKWNFLLEVMKSMGFGCKWMKWILSCLTSASISILVNDAPTNEFSLGRGVRQGYPLSPFLFLLAAEGLNILTKAAIEKGLFKGVEVSIHGSCGGLEVESGFNHLSTKGVWHTIVLAGNTIEENNVQFKNSFSKIIGDGSLTSFWHEHWIGDNKLSVLFPRLLRLDELPDITVINRFTDSRLVWNWRRQLAGRALGDFENLMSLLSSVTLDGNQQDKWNWSGTADGLFSVKVLSNAIDEHVLSSSSSPTGTLRNLAPKKVEVFVWRAIKKRLPVKLELDKRGIDLHSVRCPLYNDDLEFVDHSLIFCKHALDVCDRVFKWWNMGNFSKFSLSEIAHGDSSRNMSSFGTKVWQALLWISVYLIWKNRNNTVFQGKS
ncbi:uncharacterized protein [Rutidosis leptorrhynchoides]|uniref:uncharacterized protein n=1 Tax=Rutidosis leptorrhynchoides TaxID=125765 RepID=UPI003A999F17